MKFILVALTGLFCLSNQQVILSQTKIQTPKQVSFSLRVQSDEKETQISAKIQQHSFKKGSKHHKQGWGLYENKKFKNWRYVKHNKNHKNRLQQPNDIIAKDFDQRLEQNQNQNLPEKHHPGKGRGGKRGRGHHNRGPKGHRGKRNRNHDGRRKGEKKHHNNKEKHQEKIKDNEIQTPQEIISKIQTEFAQIFNLGDQQIKLPIIQQEEAPKTQLLIKQEAPQTQILIVEIVKNEIEDKKQTSNLKLIQNVEEEKKLKQGNDLIITEQEKVKDEAMKTIGEQKLLQK